MGGCTKVEKSICEDKTNIGIYLWYYINIYMFIITIITIITIIIIIIITLLS